MGSIVVPDPPCGTEACAENLRHLATAAESRDVIGMAKGLLMARSKCSPASAFELLRAASMRENVRLYDIAARVVAAAARSEANEPLDHIPSVTALSLRDDEPVARLVDPSSVTP